MQQNSIALSASGAPPVHDKTTVISWTFHDLVAPFQTGNFDAYLASYQGRPTWVVEVRNLNHPWENGHGPTPSLFYLHNLIELVDDQTLRAS
jgi:hypothetical protein